VRGREQGEGYGEKEGEEKQGIEVGKYGEVWKMKEKEGKILSVYFCSPIKDNIGSTKLKWENFGKTNFIPFLKKVSQSVVARQGSVRRPLDQQMPAYSVAGFSRYTQFINDISVAGFSAATLIHLLSPWLGWWYNNPPVQSPPYLSPPS
jgi:hypothetical protein